MLPDWMLAWFTEPVLASIRAWLTLIFAAVAAYVGLGRYLRDRRADQAKQRERWSLRKSRWAVVGKPKPLLLDLKLSDAALVPAHLSGIRVVSPRGARIAPPDYQSDGEGGGGYKPSAWVRSIPYSVEMTGDRQPGRPASEDATIHFFVSMPSRPFWRRSSATRLRISIEAEEMSSQRSPIRLRVRSQPIEWAASSAVSAT